ncbi:MAG: NAD(P)H-dependent oxidoreductase [Campylobacteraceae bacterium]|jgi:putative NADPH-quinone reductase|nr:NAD(P)H-dependent oxidoreductase [Campylobacteraceae bacterium]
MAKRVLIINGHPDKESLNYAISDAYEKGAIEGGAIVKKINTGELDFDLNLKFGYKKEVKLEESLLNAIAKIKDAEHIVFIFPLWWGSYPAVMKGFIDRVFLPKIAFDHDNNGKRIEFLRGKTARIIITMEQPVWYYRFVCRACATAQLKNVTLNFCGIKKVKAAYFGSIGSAGEKRIDNILKTAASIAQRDIL